MCTTWCQKCIGRMREDEMVKDGKRLLVSSSDWRWDVTGKGKEDVVYNRSPRLPVP